uniref:Uncharacterized protein n=1 Tax=Magallana gigas TaxID=29159 RepID=K1QUV5_MAGGI
MVLASVATPLVILSKWLSKKCCKNIDGESDDDIQQTPPIPNPKFSPGQLSLVLLMVMHTPPSFITSTAELEDQEKEEPVGNRTRHSCAKKLNLSKTSVIMDTLFDLTEDEKKMRTNIFSPPTFTMADASSLANCTRLCLGPVQIGETGVVSTGSRRREVQLAMEGRSALLTLWGKETDLEVVTGDLYIVQNIVPSKFIRWADSSNAVAARNEMRKPEKTCLKFNLIKVKFSFDSKKECEQYDYTTTGKTTEEESGIEEEIMPKRKPKKRIFSDFILD